MRTGVDAPCRTCRTWKLDAMFPAGGETCYRCLWREAVDMLASRQQCRCPACWTGRTIRDAYRSLAARYWMFRAGIL